jgi:hypothetical protein
LLCFAEVVLRCGTVAGAELGVLLRGDPAIRESVGRKFVRVFVLRFDAVRRLRECVRDLCLPSRTLLVVGEVVAELGVPVCRCHVNRSLG